MLETQVLSLFRGTILAWAGTRGKALKVAKPVFPSRSPFPGTLFGAYVVVCDTLLMGRWIRLYREFKAEPMDEGGREKRLA